jgi:hypothetical protein
VSLHLIVLEEQTVRAGSFFDPRVVVSSEPVSRQENEPREQSKPLHRPLADTRDSRGHQEE